MDWTYGELEKRCRSIPRTYLSIHEDTIPLLHIRISRKKSYRGGRIVSLDIRSKSCRELQGMAGNGCMANGISICYPDQGGQNKTQSSQIGQELVEKWPWAPLGVKKRLFPPLGSGSNVP
ncbi:hypothetical protein B0H17DRAFT_1134873 [Mycena rosella]|uniref:Uncharacterized protein n=1 Tax=Mycena rosella TaxID=1033263 RepID=A0AAD7GG68_MYCRO|nr:hypothetical protein B0H17DRAFT_1134873 [Mycena rosella]